MGYILVADDDNNIRKMLEILLKKQGFDVRAAENGTEALEVLEQYPVDLIITDIMMPDMDGWELCQTVREFSQIPVLMLTVRAETEDKVKGFQLGTDDYLTKPFEPEELIARVKALLKRYHISISSQLHVGRLLIDKERYTVKTSEAEVTLPPKEFELLFTLAGNPGKTYARDYLIETVWGYDFDGNERTLDVHISRLRDRFTEADSGICIRTIRGLGYRLEAHHEG